MPASLVDGFPYTRGKGMLALPRDTEATPAPRHAFSVMILLHAVSGCYLKYRQT